MTWIQDLFKPEERGWEDLYRNRWSYDKVVRSTHGVNCTGSCSWNIYVKNGIVTWELQALDYPILSKDVPPYEPRGCQRGISYSWYIYSPLRIKYPMVRGALLDAWRAAKEKHPGNPLAAWEEVTTNPETRRAYQSARGKGGFVRVSWDESREIIAASTLSTVKRYGPDRLVGFSPIPAMSMASYAAGSRFMQLLGGVSMSFYDWYCDLPPASPEIWGEQTDVAESADWSHSRFIATVGSNVLMTRTPDAHFLVEARHQGAKVVVFSPDFSQTSKIADEWIPIRQGQDAAFWLAATHVMLKEWFVDKKTPAFEDYLTKYSDGAFLVKIEREGEALRGGALLRASDLAETKAEENAEWKFFVWDQAAKSLKMPQGTMGHRWQKQKGQWNLKLEDARDGSPIAPALLLDDASQETLELTFPDFTGGSAQPVKRSVRVMKVKTTEGEVYVTTGFDLILATYGVSRGLPGAWPKNYEDGAGTYTPAWQESQTGVKAADVIRFGREFALTAEKTGGRCSVIIGAGVNHWYHNNLIYRSVIMPLILTGCVGKNGGGWNHYVGQEKLAPQASWAPIAFAGDWGGPPRLQNTPSFHYMHTDQWRYDRVFTELCPVSDTRHPLTQGHSADQQVLAVRNGWLPCFPQFNQPNQKVAADARAKGARTDEDVVKHVTDELKNRRLKFAMEDPDDPECFPRVWFIWRGNALMSSAKGHEYFLKHYLGVQSSSTAPEGDGAGLTEVTFRPEAPIGKTDLVVDLNFRMDTSALYSDIVLPAATFYEKNDLNSTDMHTFIHPLQAAVPPSWESKSDWDIFKGLAQAVSQMAEKHLPDPLEEIVATPLLHDTPAELAQPRLTDWARGKDPLIPGKTGPNLKVVKRDYARLYQKYISLGPAFRDNGLTVHGTHYEVADLYDESVKNGPVEEWEGRTYPSLREDVSVCEAILKFAPETNGELAFRAYESESKKTGIDHSHLARDTREVRYSFKDLSTQPRRLLTTPYWTGITKAGRTYSAFCQNIEERIPWRTLTGRQQMYQDHEAYRAFGESLPVYKPRASASAIRDLEKTRVPGGALVLNFLTPHGKWHIHSTFSDNLRMETLSRGIEPLWMNDGDARKAGVKDNDWVEVLNDHGVVVTRACVSARIPPGMCLIYHATERTVGTPKSPTTGRRSGGHNSLTRARLKPLFMLGGYAQFTYAFNYWGPQGINRDTFVSVKRLDKVEW